MLRVVASTSDCDYQEWQIRLMAHSREKVRQPGLLTALVATDAPATLRDRWRIPGAEVVPTRNVSPHPVAGDYISLNRAAGVVEWLEANPGDPDEVVALIDPDLVFVHPFAVDLPPGHVAGECRPDYFAPAAEPLKSTIARFCRPDAAGRVLGIGTPYVARRGDLLALARRWLDLTIAIRAADPTRWMAEMDGWAIAVAESGLPCQVGDWSRFQYEAAPADKPFIHYFDAVCGPGGRAVWSKKTWDGESAPPGPETAAHEVGRTLLALLGDWWAARPTMA